VVQRISGQPQKKKKNKHKEKKKPSESLLDEEKNIVIINNIQPPANPEPELRTINLYGDISEQKGADVVAALLYLENSSHVKVDEHPDGETEGPVIVARSIAMLVSTHGGTASDMFSILDVMDMIRERTCDIETIGIGKVMSAGVPILAAGTPGKRRVGRNCRIMLHNVMAGTGGTIFSMENELEEIKWIQERYIQTLANYTNLTPSKIKKLLKTQKDVYISAEEAIKMGIADEII
jgi:ATP-dependent Clp protease, protease subunit